MQTSINMKPKHFAFRLKQDKARTQERVLSSPQTAVNLPLESLIASPQLIHAQKGMCSFAHRFPEINEYVKEWLPH